MENLEKLIRELVTLDDETQWVEFKHNNYDPLMIGEDISALANGGSFSLMKHTRLWVHLIICRI